MCHYDHVLFFWIQFCLKKVKLKICCQTLLTDGNSNTFCSRRKWQYWFTLFPHIHSNIQGLTRTRINENLFSCYLKPLMKKKYFQLKRSSLLVSQKSNFLKKNFEKKEFWQIFKMYVTGRVTFFIYFFFGGTKELTWHGKTIQPPPPYCSTSRVFWQTIFTKCFIALILCH